jgi:ribosomal protein S12 methylthiotransferase accessory factor
MKTDTAVTFPPSGPTTGQDVRRAASGTPFASEWRNTTPAQTYRTVEPYLRRLGITRVASQTGLDRIGIPVWCAFVPNARAIVIAQGKGLDDDAARVSAVMEAVERSVATEPACSRRIATATGLKDGGERLHRLDILVARGKLPLGPLEPVSWAEAEDLLTGGRIWLPFEAVDFDRTSPSPRFWQSSDGLASGNTRNEALLHGLLERIERDALALWSVTATARRFVRRIDPTRFECPALLSLVDAIDRAGLQLALFDVTTDLGIPCAAALLAPVELDRGIRHVDLTLGAGAAMQPEGAVLRAMLEAVQSRMTFIAGARDDLLPSVFEKKADKAHLAAFRAPMTCLVDDMPSLKADETDAAIGALVQHLAVRGISELFCVDLGPEWLPVSVVKVVAPQLENPDGARRMRFGPRALARSLQ